VTTAQQLTCPQCGNPLPSPAALVCPSCGALVYSNQLNHLAAEAQWQEQFNPAQAIALWQECLKLLPPDSRQHALIQTQIDRLRTAAQSSAQPQPIEPGALPTIKQETLPRAVAKTGISMLVSIVVYKFAFGWAGAIGFVLLVLIHEMGHVVANLYYGLPASPPIFIPFLGAVINLRGNIPNAKVEAIIGIAGPVAGTIGALAVFAWYLSTKSELPLELAWFGFTINLFNLLPVPPLDGGRVAAAVSPWIWVLGLAGLGWMVLDELRTGQGPGILILVLIFALPRIIATLKPKGRSGPYYAIGKIAPIAIGAAYLLLLGSLLYLRWYTNQLLPQNGMF
jgi:Zn-dependent protease